MEKKHPPLLLERAALWLLCKARENAVPLLSSAIFGALAYMFAFTNKLVNHDEVQSLFMKGATVDSGRWGLGALDSIFPNYSMPWIYGVITIVLIAISVCILLHIFHIRSKLLQALLAGSIIVFPSLIGTFGYMFTSSSYAVSFLLAVLAVWFICKPNKLWAIPALACMVLSLSIYQSYIAIAASLLVLVLIQQLLREDNPLPVLLRGIYFVAFLIISLALYYIGTQAVLFITGTEFNSYADSSISFSLSSIPSGIALAYSSFGKFFTEGYRGLILTDFSRVCHYLCLAAVLVLLVIWAARQEKKSPARYLLLLALIVILPLAINCMYLITTPESIHTLVLYGFIAVYILAAILADEFLPQTDASLPRRISLNLITLTLSLIVLSNTYVANEAYLHMYLRYENTYSFYTSLAAQIRQTPGFDETTKIAIIGDWQKSDYYEEQFGFLSQLTGVHGIAPDSYSKNRFLEYYIGLDLTFATDEEQAAIQSTPEFTAMSAYPYYGSLQLINNILVIKLS